MNGRGRTYARRASVYFSASAIQGVLSIASLPLVTMVLGPADYGIYALLTSFVIVAVGAADLGLNVLLAEHFATIPESERQKLVSSSLYTSWGVALALAAVFVPVWSATSHLLVGPQVDLPAGAIWLTALAIPFRSISSSAGQVFMVAGQPLFAALLLVIQAVVIFVATLVALFVFDAGLLALFIGGLLGTLTSALTAIRFLQPLLRFEFSVAWAQKLFHIAPTVVVASLAETSRAAFENILIARFAGSAMLGLFSHAKTYYALLMQGTNAVTYVLWPRALAEARESGDFRILQVAWRLVHFWLIVAGLIAATLGREVVDLLTHGKFVAAVPWIAFLIAYLLLQNTGKAASAVLYAVGRGVWVSKLRLMTIIPSLVAMWLLVPRYQITAVFGVLFAEIVLFRIVVGMTARRHRRIAFHDRWAVVGAPAIALLAALLDRFQVDFASRLGVLSILLLLTLLVGWRVVSDSARHVWNMMHNERPAAT